MTAAGLVIVVGALLFFCTTLAYTFGAWRGTADLDDNFEIAKALGAYGAYLRLEAEALGVTVEELAERDARLARGEDA